MTCHPNPAPDRGNCSDARAFGPNEIIERAPEPDTEKRIARTDTTGDDTQGDCR